MAKKPQQSLKAFGKEYSLPKGTPEGVARLRASQIGRANYDEERARAISQRGDGSMLASNKSPKYPRLEKSMAVNMNAYAIMSAQMDDRLKAKAKAGRQKQLKKK
jgi:hypothetical protein